MLSEISEALPRPRWMALSADPVFRGLVGVAMGANGAGRLVQAEFSTGPLAWMAGASLLVMGLSLTLGLWTRLSALLLLVVWSGVTLPGAMATPGALTSVGPVLEGLAVPGSLYLIYVRGGGQISVDRLRRKRPTAKPSRHGRAMSRHQSVFRQV